MKNLVGKPAFMGSSKSSDAVDGALWETTGDERGVEQKDVHGFCLCSDSHQTWEGNFMQNSYIIPTILHQFY